MYWQNEGGGAGVASAPSRDFRLIHRNYGRTLVRIGGHYFPRKSLLLAASETVLIMSSLVMATALRFLDLQVINEYLFQPRTWVRFGLVTAICQLALYYNELYHLPALRNLSAQLVRAMRAVGLTMLVLAFVYYLVPVARLERGIAVLAAAVAFILMFFLRLSFGFGKDFTHPVERVLVLGTGDTGVWLAHEIMRRPELQYKVVGFLDEKCPQSGRLVVSPGIIGEVSQLEEIVDREEIDRVVISLAERRGIMPIRELTGLKVQGLPIEDAHSIYERLTGRIMLEHLRPSWIILSDGFGKSRLVVMFKRIVDILVSAFLILLASPLMAITAISILLDSGKPIFYRQERVGRGGRNFMIWKFRSMRTDPENTPQWTASNDPRITRVGNFIRKYRLDELPQLLNVLRGEMSLIGPRPEIPYYCELLEREIPYFNQRHSVRPGITGWAQVKFQYGASLEDAKTKFEYDLFYIKHLSVLLDLAIILETVKVVFLGKGAR